MVYGKEENGKITISVHIFPAFDEVKSKLGEDYKEEDLKELLAKEIKTANEQMPSYKNVTDFDIRDTEFVKTTTKKIKRYSN